MSKRKGIKNNRKKRKVKLMKISDKPYVIGSGIFMLLFFLWTQFSNNGDINESELITIKGKLNSELIHKSTGGAQKTHYWVFSIKNQPINFSIGGYAKTNFDSKTFKKIESKESNITIKVDKTFYNKIIQNSSKKEIGVKYLFSNNHEYFDLNDYNKNKKTDMKVSYLFLILGIGAIIFGLRMKK